MNKAGSLLAAVVVATLPLPAISAPATPYQSGDRVGRSTVEQGAVAANRSTVPRNHKEQSVLARESFAAIWDESRQQEYEPQLLKKLLSLRSGEGLASAHDYSGLENMRLEAMAEEARRLGAQAALHWRNQQIHSILEQYVGSLDIAFNFGPLMIDEVVLPPVIQRVERASRQYDYRTMRTVQVGYRYSHPARIVTTPPTWRSFLVRTYPTPQPPADVLLPENDDERALWHRNVRRGWRAGIIQANRNFRVSLDLLTSTYLGMLQYKILLAQGVVSKPNLATTKLRITSHGRSLNIGDRIYRLTEQSQFTDSGQWDAVPTPVAGEGQ